MDRIQAGSSPAGPTVTAYCTSADIHFLRVSGTRSALELEFISDITPGIVTRLCRFGTV